MVRRLSGDPVIDPERIEEFFRENDIGYITSLLIEPEWQRKLMQEGASRIIPFGLAPVYESNPHIDPFTGDRRRMPRLSLGYLGGEIGYGCFAQERIAKNAPVREFAGTLRSAGCLESDSYCLCLGTRQDYGVFISMMADALDRGNESRFVNHASPYDIFQFPDGSHGSGANLATRLHSFDGYLHAFYVARRDIAQGEELRSDYCNDSAAALKPTLFFLREGSLAPEPLRYLPEMSRNSLSFALQPSPAERHLS